MNKRDTIIIALLVNAGLLALLFMLAINPEDEVLADQPEIAKTLTEARVSKESVAASDSVIVLDTSTPDEVDSFLTELASENPAQTVFVDEEGYLSVQPEKKPVKVDTQIAKQNVLNLDDSNYVNVTVKRGDALEKIARNNGTTVEEIKKVNQLSTAKLAIGQILKVPVSNSSEKTPPKQTGSVLSSSPPKESEKKSPISVPAVEVQYYTIKSGDNPWKIAKQFNVKFEELLKLNNLDEERARNLKIGDKVRVK